MYLDSKEKCVNIKGMGVLLTLYLVSTMVIGQKKKKIGQLDFHLDDLELRKNKFEGK